MNDVAMNLNHYATQCHLDNHKWWIDLETGKKKQRNKGELLMLIVSELGECLEGIRKDLRDSHLPHRRSEDVEIVDALIRLFDYCGAHGIQVEEIYQEKRAYNLSRKDHTLEARKLDGGKKF